jgi:hypothetical protein
MSQSFVGGHQHFSEKVGKFHHRVSQSRRQQSTVVEFTTLRITVLLPADFVKNIDQP